MYNIWGFLLQTISVSIVAAIILLLKYIFADKLSPRWQYGVWILLGIRILMPVNITKYIIPQISYWMEVIKGYCEKLLTSNYSEVYEPITLHHMIPIITEVPQSITDWLFVIYAAGIIMFGVKYLSAYVRLRILLKRGKSATSDMEQKMLYVCDKYDLTPCKMITIDGLTSAFICGVFRPVLVVPNQDDIDEKILLHELLHLKHHDSIQNIFWCVLRTLHWCNPLIHYAVNQIENDMESLCDQRVLECLEGEERREYGTILLNMASQKYARVPGTTSISNGSKNISKRIASIVRFKKYPQGMVLVSVCIIMVLFWPMIIGSAKTFEEMDYLYLSDEWDNSMAIARINRCSTVAGAIDMYAKGIYKMNGAYVASASSFSEHERIKQELETYGCYQSGKYIGNIVELYDYYVYNLDQKYEKEYTAFICYYASMSIDEYVPELLEYIDEENDVYMCDAYIFLPVSIRYEDAWVVEEVGERYLVSLAEYNQQDSSILCGKAYYGKNDIGEVLLEVETKYTVDNSIQNNNVINMGGYWNTAQFDTSPKPDAIFNYIELNKYIVYNHLSNDILPNSCIELEIKAVESDDYMKNKETELALGNDSEAGWTLYETISSEWDGTFEGQTGGGYGGYEVDITDLPSGYFVQLIMDNEKTEKFTLEEVEK